MGATCGLKAAMSARGFGQIVLIDLLAFRQQCFKFRGHGLTGSLFEIVEIGFQVSAQDKSATTGLNGP